MVTEKPVVRHVTQSITMKPIHKTMSLWSDMVHSAVRLSEYKTALDSRCVVPGEKLRVGLLIQLVY